MDTYKLRAVLQGHSADVKMVSSSLTSPGSILSASRDKTARLWLPMDDNTYCLRNTYKGHPKYVSCVTSLESSEEYPSGLILTGCQDGKIRAFLPDVEDPLFELDAHQENVTSLYASKFGTIISGSWDKTAKVWFNRKCTMTLEGHDLAVWCVGILPGVGIMITGSADKTIRVWKTGKCENVLKGHTDAVRGFAIIDSDTFLSCANDATVRRWSLSGGCLGTYYGHENYIYSIALLPNGVDWVTSGEDRSVRVWEKNEVVQTVYLPAISVWSVCVLPNGDIVSGSSDATIRVFTKEAARQASPELIEAFETELSRSSLAAQQELGGVKLTDLPGPEALYEPGRKDGQTKMVRVGDSVAVHSWSMAEQKWSKIGDVVGAAGGSQSTSGKKLHQGKEYDYVFDIEIDEPKATLKLPFNLTDDPYMAAQAFIHKHDLSQYYLEEIANHIMKNTGGQTLGVAGNADPLTGGASYSAGGGGQATGMSGLAADPFTGSGAYTSGAGGEGELPVVGGGAPPPDPWMQGAYKTEDAAMDSVEVNPYFPHTTYLRFEAPFKADALLNKLKELNQKVPADDKLGDDQIEGLPNLALSPVDDLLGVEALCKALRWPDECVFPVLDLLRLVLLHPLNHKHLMSMNNLDTVFTATLKYMERESNVNNQMLSLRCLTNLFSTVKGEDELVQYRNSILTTLLEKFFPIASSNKNIQIGVASFLLNYAVAYYKRTGDTDGQIQTLSVIIITMLPHIRDAEARFRAMVAMGTLMSISQEHVAYAKSLDMYGGIRNWKILGEDKVVKVAQLLLSML